MSIWPMNDTISASTKRRAVCAFFAETFGLPIERVDESEVELLPIADLQTFRDGWPVTAVRSADELERMIENLKQY